MMRTTFFIGKLIKLKDFVLNIDNILRFNKVLSSDKLCRIAKSYKRLYREFLCPILAKNLSSTDRLLMLLHNYTYMYNHLSSDLINNMLDGMVTIWISKDLNIPCKIVLNLRVHGLEGVFRLSYLYNNESIYVFGFSIVSGNSFGSLDEDVILISRMQLDNNKSVLYKDAIKQNARTTPAINLYYAIIGIATRLKINTIVSVSAENQISNKKGMLSFHKTYNDFFENFEGIERVNDYYILRLPYTEKPTKSSHRKRSMDRRDFNSQIKISACLSLDDLVSV